MSAKEEKYLKYQFVERILCLTVKPRVSRQNRESHAKTASLGRSVVTFTFERIT